VKLDDSSQYIREEKKSTTYEGEILTKSIRAVYEKGVLKLLENVDLRDGEEVKVIIVRSSYGLSKVIEEISREYRDVNEDPLKVLLESRR